MLFETLRFMSDMGMNLEHVTQVELTDRILKSEQSLTYGKFGESSYLFDLVENSVALLPKLSEKQVAQLGELIPAYIKYVRYNPTISKRMIALLRDIWYFLASPDFLMFVMHADPYCLKDILSEAISNELGRPPGPLSDVEMAFLWERRAKIIDEVRRRIREQTYSVIAGMQTTNMVNRP